MISKLVIILKMIRGVAMQNHRGMTIQDRILNEIDFVRDIEDKKLQQTFITRLLGAVDFAVEFKLITFEEWDKYIGMIFAI